MALLLCLSSGKPSPDKKSHAPAGHGRKARKAGAWKAANGQKAFTRRSVPHIPRQRTLPISDGIAPFPAGWTPLPLRIAPADSAYCPAAATDPAVQRQTARFTAVPGCRATQAFTSWLRIRISPLSSRPFNVTLTYGTHFPRPLPPKRYSCPGAPAHRRSPVQPILAPHSRIQEPCRS